MKFNKLLARLFGLALIAAAIAPLPGASAQAVDQEQQAEVEDNRITLQIENNNWLDVRVYVVSGSLIRRIGTVTSLTTEEFTLPRYLNTAANDLRIAISPIGARGVHYSFPLIVNPGDHVEYRVANNLGLSRVQRVS